MELEVAGEEMRDPCAEDENSPVHGLVHRYPDRHRTISLYLNIYNIFVHLLHLLGVLNSDD